MTASLSSALRRSALLALLAAPLAAQNHSTPVADRFGLHQIARANGDQNSVTVIDTSTDSVIDLDPLGPGVSVKVGAEPRTLAYLRDGTKLYVANMRGEGGTFPNQVFGSVTVLDATNGYQLVKTITEGIGVEPFGVAAAIDGGFVAVTNFRSHSVSFIDPVSDTVSFVFQYQADPNLPGVTQAMVDSDLDGQPDHANPRGILVEPGGQAVYVTHFLSGHVTKIALQRHGSHGPVVGGSLAADMDLNTYEPPVDGQGQPIFVTEDISQGKAVNLESITLAPDGVHAWVPHTLLNFRVKVEAERFSVDNQAYPAVSIIDLQTGTFEFGSSNPSDTSNRIQFDPALAEGQVRNLGLGLKGTGGIVPNLDVMAEPVPGGAVDLRLFDARGGATGLMIIGLGTTELHAKGGTIHVGPIAATMPITLGGSAGLAGAGDLHFGGALPDASAIVGLSIGLQAVVNDPEAVQGFAFSNAGVLEIGQASLSVPDFTFGRRVAQPVQVEFSEDGKRAFVFGLASEDVTVFDVASGVAKYQTSYPDRSFVRVPFSASQPMGENPNGAVVKLIGPSVSRLYITNSTSQDVTAVSFSSISNQFSPGTLRLSAVTDDTFTPAERRGREMFMDATRLQTTSDFNGSCSECHFDGLQDGLTWHFNEGPRRTISLAGGPMNFGLIFAKSNAADMTTFAGGFRIHQGGNGQFTPADFDGFTTWTNTRVPMPLNPRQIGGPTLSELRGKDLFFGTNDAGSNPSLRSANCAECHPAPNFTFDVMFDPADPCASLQQSKANLRDVGSVDQDGLLTDDIDFDFTWEGCDDGLGTPTLFHRAKEEFSTPTKLDAFAIAPYFHTGAALNLRGTLDPGAVGMPAQFLDSVHDLNGFIVSVTLLSPPSQQDIEDMLAYISSL
jgi:DNA-binding beta-propeller fold protein YncE